MLGGVDALVEGFGGVVVQDGHGLLADDGAGVDTGVHEMDGAASGFHAGIECLSPGFQAGERRQEGGMNIHDAALERAQKIAFENAHKTGEDYEIHPRVEHGLNVKALGVFIEFGAKFSGGDESRGKVARAGVGQGAGRFDVAQYEGNGGRDFPGGTGIGDGGEIRAFARTQDANAKFLLVGHGLYLQAGSGRRQAV